MWTLEMSAFNTTVTHNIFAVPVIITFRLFDWTPDENLAIDVKTCKILTHMSSDTDRAYIKRKSEEEPEHPSSKPWQHLYPFSNIFNNEMSKCKFEFTLLLTSWDLEGSTFSITHCPIALNTYPKKSQHSTKTYLQRNMHWYVSRLPWYYSNLDHQMTR